ncbi:hypothetical protein HBH56_099600 [Parastagonospora nodorum]|uniref:Uncharacterized protein n=1 Tax=Phaeosphaeria nodorum (strain SN15 / ATCC MYA-4574 / FGSC 10173) TaxID=321614 RepID=A0A7U2ICQ7_PHANO|nr:hypothetical protein HBH56_099600 [Parastagonospora nodorum]QRD07462.1 hypothetical protein JI435_131460 [Parastagonospora nodorum SN15]KAH3930467.1 hypothetical protein HBH54_113920 [Parastagonospora nodorum]KAH3942938.1 hypothetical protein HBH53_182050 [Parastagonospora nodorum]KAH4002835.1 hypothetical protein HBI10_065420 [Parastagonospora nodorum]
MSCLRPSWCSYITLDQVLVFVHVELSEENSVSALGSPGVAWRRIWVLGSCANQSTMHHMLFVGDMCPAK